MNFVAKPPSACNNSLHLSASPQHLAAAQTIFCFEHSSVSSHGFLVCRREEVFVSANEFEPLSALFCFFVVVFFYPIYGLSLDYGF